MANVRSRPALCTSIVDSRGGLSLCIGLTVIELVRKYRARAALIFIAVVAEMLFNVMIPLSLQHIIDDALAPRNSRVLVLIIGALGIGAIIVALTGLGRDYLSAALQGSLLADLRQTMFDHYQRLSIASHSKMESGEVLSRFSTDLAAVENMMGMAVPWGFFRASKPY